MPRKRTKNEVPAKIVDFKMWDYEKLVKYLDKKNIKYQIEDNVLKFVDELNENVHIELKLKIIQIEVHSLVYIQSTPYFPRLRAHTNYGAYKMLVARYKSFEAELPSEIRVDQQFQFRDGSETRFAEAVVRLELDALEPIIENHLWIHKDYNLFLTQSSRSVIRFHNPNQSRDNSYFGFEGVDAPHWFLFDQRGGINVDYGKYLLTDEQAKAYEINDKYRDKIIYNPVEFEHVQPGRLMKCGSSTYLITHVNGQDITAESGHESRLTLKHVDSVSMVQDNEMQWGIVNHQFGTVISSTNEHLVLRTMKIENSTFDWVIQTVPVEKFCRLSIEPYQVGEMLDSKLFTNLITLYDKGPSAPLALLYFYRARTTDQDDWLNQFGEILRSPTGQNAQNFEEMLIRELA